MKQLSFVALGSAVGGVARHSVDQLGALCGVGAFPIATLWINLSGSFLIGWLAGRWATDGAVRPHPYQWHFWMTGVCGGYTTFSAFTWQVLDLVNQGEGTIAGFYATGSIGVGLIAVWWGLSLAIKGRSVENTQESS